MHRFNFNTLFLSLRILPVICWTLGAIPGMAQSSAISGLVTDHSGGIIREAKILLTNEKTGVSQKTLSNDTGIYNLPFIVSGQYQLSVEATGFKKYEQKGIILETGQSLANNIRLEVGTTNETISVDGSGIHINTVDASVSTLIDRKFVENIPMNGRTLQSLMTLVPGVSVVPSTGIGYSGEMTVNGQRTESNYFTVDGVSANINTGTSSNPPGGAGISGATAGQTALGTTQSMVSLDALQEFRASTSTYSAEYGRTPGGQFSFTTRSGTNEFRGTLFNYFRNDVLDANDFFSKRAGIRRQPKRQNDFGGTLGGPLHIPRIYNGSNRTFFFFSYEGLRLRIPQEGRTIDVPSMALRSTAPAELRPFLNAWPVPKGPETNPGFALYTSAYSYPGTLNATSFRLDHSFSNSFKVFGRYNWSPSSTGTRTASNPANADNSGVRVKTLTLGATSTFTPALHNDLRFNFTNTDSRQDYRVDSFGGATPLDLSSYPGIGVPDAYLRFGLDFTVSNATFFLPRHSSQNQFNWTDTVVANIGAHTLKFGVDYRRQSNNVHYPMYNYRISYLNLNEVMQNKPGSFLVYKSSGNFIKPVFHNFSAFIQDEWKATRRLSLSLGLRWDVNPPPTDSEGNTPYTITSTNLATLEAAPKNTQLWKTRYLNLAPRLGGAYQLGQKAGWETVLRAGVGLFFDMGTQRAHSGYEGLGSSTLADLTGVAFPLSQKTLDEIALPNISTPYSNALFGFDPNLQSPRTWQWNASLQQALGSDQTLSMSYIGSAGRKLLHTRIYYPNRAGNPNFMPNGILQLTSNGSTSDYNALQIQFQRRMAHGFQIISSYTWSHSLDDATSNFNLSKLLRASSDYDIRNNAQLALTYELPSYRSGHLFGKLISDWAIDSRISSRSALPVDVLSSTTIDPGSGLQISYQPNLIAGQPLYVDEQNAPGGRRINFNAFSSAPSGVQGNAGRNIARAFGATQVDLSVRRELRFGERVRLQLRGEAFNLLNQSIFGAVYNQLSLGTSRFGYAYSTQNTQLRGVNSLYQVGGPRSIQIALKFLF